MPSEDTATSLTEAALSKAAGANSFGRGEDYVRYVHGLRVVGSTATASIQARRVYLVDLEWSRGVVEGRCTCPHHAKGNFCKHLVAVGLAVLDGDSARRRTAAQEEPDESGAVTSYLASLDEGALRRLVGELAERHPDIERTLQIRAAATGTDQDGVAAELKHHAQSVLSIRGFIDYRRSFDVASDAHQLLDELEDHLSTGAADAVRPALLKALTRLRKITERADDSSGSLGDSCQRAADLYARSCREGSPDPVKLARWLVKFRGESPGWPETTLQDFVDAFDDKALAVYRRAVAQLDARQVDADRWSRLEIDRMLLELADHDDDVDEAVRVLSRDDNVEYGAIVDRLKAAGRDDEAFEWLERGVAAGRVSAHQPGRSYWLTAEEVADAYLARGRNDDALAVQRAAFASRPELPRFRALMDVAVRVGEVEQERARVFALLEEQARAPYGSGAARIQIAIAECDLETAWSVAEEYGAGHAWQQLAGALARDHPGRAAELYQPRIDEALKPATSSAYPAIAADLAVVRDLCERAGESAEFAAYLDGIRKRYGRRPSLMAALDRHGL